MIRCRQDCNSCSEGHEGSSGGRKYAVGRVSPTSQVALTRLLSESRGGNLEPVKRNLRFAGLAAGILRVEEAAEPLTLTSFPTSFVRSCRAVLSCERRMSETRYHYYLYSLDGLALSDRHGS